MNETTQSKFEEVRDMLTDLGLPVTGEDPKEGMLVVNDDDRGLASLVIDVDDPILILEMPILSVNRAELPSDLLVDLLQWNRQLVHGAFALNEAADLILWRDTLALGNLDPNEVESSIDALEIALAEHAGELLDFKR